MRIVLTVFLILISLSSTALAETVYVGNDKEYDLLPHAALYNDLTQQMSVDDLKNVIWQDIDVSELAFPVSDAAHWLCYDVENNSSFSKAYYLEYNVPTINFLDVYIVQEGVVLQSYLTGAHRPLENRALVYHSYIFPITLEPGEKKEIYVRLKHLYSTIPANLTLKEQTEYLLNDYAKNVLEGAFFGVIMVMFLYNFLLFLMTRFRPYIAYVLYLGTFGTWLSFRMGYGQYLFDFMSVGFYRYFEIAISVVFPVFIIWFITGVLELKKVMSRVYIFFNLINALFILLWASLWTLMYLEIDSYYSYPSLLFFINFMVMNIAIVVVTSILLLRGSRTALFILLAWVLFISSMVILALSLTNVIPSYEWIMPFLQITMVIETVALSLILGDRFHQQEQLIRQQSRLAAMGSMIENIAHQWRQPLSEVNADLLALEMHIEDEDRSSIKKRMQYIEEKTQMMSKTIDDFQNFYNTSKTKETFNLQAILQQAIELNERRLNKHKVVCIVSEHAPLNIDGVRNEFLQVLLAILNNAIDALDVKEDQRHITIDITKEGTMAAIMIVNNGPLITRKDLPRLFEPYFTTKETNRQSGIGLYMSKRIIEESFHGTLELTNLANGVKAIIKVAHV